MVTLAVRISRLCTGHIPATCLVEDMIRIAPQFGRDADYVLTQCQNLQLGREDLPKLHEACGYDAARAFKVLLAYEHGIANRDEIRTEIRDMNDAAFHSLEFLVNEHLDRNQQLGLPCYVL
jgi:hypothetical protein